MRSQTPSLACFVHAIAAAAALLACTAAPAAGAAPDSLPPHILVGYWHNFTNEAGAIRLTQVPQAYDVVNVAFAVSGADGATMEFTPAAEIYADNNAFTTDLAALKAQGKKVLISIGGANSVVQLKTAADVQSFVSSMSSIISTFGFDGVDVDLEGASVSLNAGDTDFRAPTTPIIVNLIKALRQLVAQFPGGLLLTMAPETAYVQGGYTAYAGIFGAYLPVVHALRDILTFIQVQHYNTGSMNGRDGNQYNPATADFHVAMADMLLGGFKVNAYRETGSYPFPPLLPRQVLIGLPAVPAAASSGYTPTPAVLAALNYLLKGVPYGGKYVLSNPAGYPGFRGLMTWSINWDVKDLLAWSAPYRKYFDTVTTITALPQPPSAGGSAPRGVALAQNYPNPFNPSTTISFDIPHQAVVDLKVYNTLGQEVTTLVHASLPAGRHEVEFRAANLPSGLYLYRLTSGPSTTVKKMMLVK